MTSVAIVGAGPFGGALAHKIAARDRFAEVRLIDPVAGVAAGQALDIQQAAAVESFRTTVIGESDLDAVSGASVIVLADPTEATAERAEELGRLKRLATYNRRAIIVCAAPGYPWLIGRGVLELGIPRGRIIGTAPAAFQAALKAIVGVELRCSSTEVGLAVLGRPPDRAIIPWGSATVRGYDLTSQAAPGSLGRLQQRVGQIGPPGPYVTASATARVCEAVTSGSRTKGLSVFYALDGELGVRRTVAAVSVELDAGGVRRVIEPSLTGREQVQLDTVLQALPPS